MYFIEALFGMSPDSGSGTLEVALAVIALTCGAVIWRLLAAAGKRSING